MVKSAQAQPEEHLRGTVPDHCVELPVAHTAGRRAVRPQSADEAAGSAQVSIVHKSSMRVLRHRTISSVLAAERSVLIAMLHPAHRLFFGDPSGNHEPASMVVQQHLLPHQQQPIRWTAPDARCVPAWHTNLWFVMHDFACSILRYSSSIKHSSSIEHLCACWPQGRSQGGDSSLRSVHWQHLGGAARRGVVV
jgi:hypothetical protein